MISLRQFIQRLRRVRWHNTLVAVLLIVAIPVGFRVWPHDPLRSWLPSSTAVYDADGRLLRLTLASDQRYRLWVPLRDISSAVTDGVLLHEDRWFYWHPGFNAFGLLRGAWVTYVRGGHPQGGSTITMQLARLLWKLDTRSPRGKIVQIARAVQLELYYSKRDILEAYLNDAPYGRNVEGVGAASLAYFGKSPDRLSLPEALTLAVIPQDPSRRLQADATSGDAVIDQWLAASRNRLFARWVSRHPEDKSAQPLFDLPLRLRSLSRLPFEAPHFVEQILAARRLEGGGDMRVTTTLDLRLQHSLERQVRQYVEHAGDRGIRNAAALLIDTRDMGVKAMVGSADYFDSSIAGQVNGTLAKRSPGSTLKPFIYALGFDQGVLHPQTVLRDVPTAFGPYTPENFDGHFLGPVTATQALIRSRNIPAVYVASRLASPNLYQFLRDAGVSRMASESHYGLALVLGGGEVTMQELGGLYAMLANRGSLKPLRMLASEPQTSGTRVLSDEATFMTMDMLRQNPRPDDAIAAQSSRLPIYWKTGTSWSFRDAWTAGSFGPYVLVIWIGNFDGSGNPAFVGVEAAAPLFFRIADALRAERPGLAEPIRRNPANLRRVSICLASGDLPNAWCPQLGTTWFIPGKSPIKVSTVHRPVVIDSATGKPACPPFDPAHTRTEVYEYWPSDLQRVFAQAGMARRTPPPLPDCQGGAQFAGDPPRITSPVRGTTYTMRASRIGEERIAFTATTDASSRQLYWFVDNAYLGSAPTGQSLMWQPERTGKFVVRVVDDQGRSDSRPLSIAADL
ncbi:penicillin-binding protein 1C [Luteibacter rhizovicinus]|uniref:peptidoglycan glycosyltransferase n=1 Tax=Luteibacter rhizovicinus TaxID=242606 RepID=A0A4R3YV09_9GAMM|nr:penicillin-binding protein 1C [Luteibacter rhizovicinus]TCV96451.1 penicillin-binding protein 1C [Luteibacter rhizovicinus]